VEPAVREHFADHGSAPAAAAAQTEALLGSWVDLYAVVIGYRNALRFCACASGVGLLLSFFVSRKGFCVFDADTWAPQSKMFSG
jgi:hypothetical protein